MFSGFHLLRRLSASIRIRASRATRRASFEFWLAREKGLCALRAANTRSHVPAKGDNPVRWLIPLLFAQNAQALALSVGHTLQRDWRPLTLPICAIVT